MNVGKALYNILSNDAEIVAICGTRVYPEIADQDAALPFIVYKVSDIQPSGTKSGSSSLDTARVDVYCVSEEYGEAMTISDEVRSALDRVGGTYTGVNIQSIDFDTADVEFDSDQRAYIAEATYNVRVLRVGQAPDINIQPLSILTVEEVDGDPSGTVNKLVVSNGSLSIAGSTATVTTGGNVTSVNTQTGDVVLDADDISDAATTNKFATQAQLDKVDHLTVTQAVNLDTIESDTATNNAKVGYTDGAVDARIAAASITDLSDTPGTLGSAGQVVAVNTGGTALEFVDQSVVSVQYHGRYDTEAETKRSGATATLEVYYTARPDGDGFAESEVSDVGETDTINRTLFYSTKYLADPDTAGDWTEYTTQPADNATFATAKAALLAGLNETDATAETRGTLPLSLKMVRTTSVVSGDLLLDTYTGADAAYSVRKLDKDYTGYCMKVRRASDDAEADIGFDSNGDLDTAAIATHAGASAAYCSVWYDQSGNSHNATQSTPSLQPQIYNGTSVFTNGSPARPEIRATTNARMVLGTLAHDVDRKYFAATTASVSSFCVLFGSSSTADYELLAKSGDTGSIFDGGGAIVNRNGVEWFNVPTLTKDRDDVWTDFSSQSIVMIDHQLALVTGRTTQLGYATNGIPMFHMQELIIYPTGTSHAVSDIEDAINSYFQVYT